MEAGWAASTLKVHMAAKSVNHGHIDGRSVSVHYWMTQFLPGARRLCPFRVIWAADWDLPLVLQAMNGSLFEPMVEGPLGYISMKTTFLLAIATAKRVSEFHALF